MKRVVSYLLMVALCVTVFSIFGYGYMSVYTPVLALEAVFLFLLCHVADRNNLVGGLVFILYFGLVGAVVSALFSSGFHENGMVFLEWLLTRGDEAVSQRYYLMALSVLCVTFFGITVYYFTLIRYRINILTLVCVMPCVLYAKVVAEVDDTYLVVIALLSVLAAVYHTRVGEENAASFKRSAPAVTQALVFAIAVILIGALIPRKSEAKYYDRFEDLFLMRGNKDEAAEADLSFLNDISGDADGYQNVNPRRLFMLKGDVPPYLKRHNFDYYDYESNHWYKEKDFAGMMDSASYPATPQLEAETGRLFEALLLADELSPGLLGRYGLDRDLIAGKKDMLHDSLHSILIMPIDFHPQYFLGASRQAALFGADSYSKRYSIYYFPDHLTGIGIAENRLAMTDLDSAENLLREAAQILLENVGDTTYAAARRSIDYFYARNSEALVYRNFMGEENKKIPQSVRELAVAATEGAASDWEKALALQKYFHSGRFTYDLAYDAPDDSPEYFLNKSRTGTCSDFAGAYVLMARAVGLSVRYAEGFKTEESTREGYYYIRETGSHAYPEVYIPLTGWCVFEPTVAAVEEPGLFERLGIDIRMDYGLIHTVIVTGVILAIAGAVLRVFWPFFAWIFFGISLLFTPRRKRAQRRYRRLVKKLSDRLDEDLLSLTPREFLAWYAAGWPKRVRKHMALEKLINRLEEDLYKGE